jgi:hypothetical protein
MRRQNILRTLLFIFFFSIGAAALSGSILCDDLVRYYRDKQLLRAAEESLNRLKSLNADYDVLLRQLEQDPNVIKRIARATLGTGPTDANTVYPKATTEQLDAARKVLTVATKEQPPEPAIPDWIMRCSEPPRRTVLFLAGAFLILISFIWFGPAKDSSREQQGS